MEDSVKNQLVDEYIAQFPARVQDLLTRIRAVICQAAPSAVETIKYRMPTYVLNENLVHFAGYSKHIGFYPTPSAIEQFKEEIIPYTWSKGAVQFPLDRPIPYDLIRRMTEFRVAMVQAKVKPSRK